MIKVRLLLTLVLLPFLYSCAPSSKNIPAWITTNQHPAYPRSEYLIGIGAAPLTRDKAADITRADARARSEKGPPPPWS